MERPDDLVARVVEELPVGVFALDDDGRVLLWNRAAERLTGRPRAAVLGRPVAASLDPPGAFLDQLAERRPFTGPFPAPSAGPAVQVRAVPAVRPGIAALGVLEDVTDLRAGDEAFALLDALWESAPVGLAYFDTALRYRRVNGAVLDIDGGTSDQRLGRTLPEVHGAVGETIAAGLQGVLDDGRARLDVPISGRLWHGSGPLQEWRMNLYPVLGLDGATLGCGVVLVDVTRAEHDRREFVRVAAEREEALTRYQSLIEATSAAVWVREVDGTARRDAPGLRAITGQSLAEMRGWGFLDAVHPTHDAAWRAAWERAVTAAEPEVFTLAYRLRTAAGGYRWFRSRAVPVRVDGRVAEWVGTETDIDDAMLARHRLDVLAQASFEMNVAIEPDGELAALAEAAVPDFADVCRVYLVDPLRDGGAVTGRRSVSRTAPEVPDSPMTDTRFVFGTEHPIARCVRSAAPVLAQPPADPRAWHPTAQLRRWGAEVDAHSVLVAPVLSGGVVVAALLFVGCADRPRYTEDDLGLAAELGVRASAAVERSTAFHQSRQVAVALQAAMLSEPPAVPGCEIEARYLPAAAGLAVGGDWYDAFLLAGGGLAVGVGDVAGHDLPAAATMGQLRSMLRALADGDGPPSSAVARLDRVATRLEVTRFTTLVHGHVLRREDGDALFRWCNAGHPAPILVPPAGEPRFLRTEVDIVLGVAPGSPRRDTEVDLPPGSTLLLYTDGLLERRRDPDDRAGTELLALVAEHADRPLGDFCDHLVRGTAADTDDDIVVLAVRVA